MWGKSEPEKNWQLCKLVHYKMFLFKHYTYAYTVHTCRWWTDIVLSITNPEVQVAIVVVTSQNVCVSGVTDTQTFAAQSITRVAVLYNQRESGRRALQTQRSIDNIHGSTWCDMLAYNTSFAQLPKRRKQYLRSLSILTVFLQSLISYCTCCIHAGIFGDYT